MSVVVILQLVFRGEPFFTEFVFQSHVAVCFCVDELVASHFLLV